MSEWMTCLPHGVRHAMYLASLSLVAPLWCAAAYAGIVQCDPEIVSFSGLDGEATIKLYVDGAALPSDAVRGARAMIDDRNYSHQFYIERSEVGPAQLKIRLNPAQVQVGTFTLRIDTREGPACASIKTPLDELPGTLENRAAALGISVDQLRAELHLVQKAEREQVAVTLPESYEEGYLFELKLGENPEHDYRWIVNGEVVASGRGEGTLRHVFSQTGPNSIQFEERAGDGLVAAWTGRLQVNPAPAVPWDVPVNTAFTLAGPPGYENYRWSVNGERASRDAMLRHTFKQPGEHTIECLAENAMTGYAQEYRRMTWHVSAK